MSIKVVGAVWECGAYEASTLLVLLAFADWANDDGTKIYPRLSQVMKKARLSERGARDCIRRLKLDRTIVLVEEADGTRGRANEWRIDLQRLAQVAGEPRGQNLPNQQRGQIETVTGADNDRHGGKSLPSPHTPHIDSTVIQPSLQPSSPPAGASGAKTRRRERKKHAEPEGFEAFYEAYPRHIGRGQAERAYIQALKYATPQALLEGAQRYTLQRLHQDPEYTKHPSTWLNGKCWLDDAAPAKANGNGQPVFEQTTANGWYQRLLCFYGHKVTDDPDTSVPKGTWLKTWGPRPETVGCKVPEEAYTQFRQQHQRRMA